MTLHSAFTNKPPSYFLKFTAPMVQATTTCSNNLLVRFVTISSGLLQSSVSSSYSSKMDCSWSLSSNTKLELVFVNFNTESSADYMYVYDGDSTSSPLIGQFSGSSVPAPIESSCHNLHFRFTLDGSNEYSGFRALYRGMVHLLIVI